MSLNVTGYPLEFDAKINTDGLTAGVKSVKDNLTALTDPLKAGLNAIDNSLDDLLVNMRKLGSDPELENLFTKYAALQKQELTLNDTLSKATDPTQIKAYNDQLAKVHDQMKAVANDVKSLPGVSNDLSGANQTIAAYTKLRQLKNEIAQMALDGGRGSEEYEKLNQEAIKLQNSIRNTNKELTLGASNTAGLEALKESVRGIAGAFEAVSGAIAIFGGDSKQAEEATKAVIGAMGVLNGIEEVTAILSKDSAVNFYLEGLMHKSAAAATGEHAAAAQTLAVAEGEQAVATEAAEVAQTGLNVAMLANPVGIILGSIVALYGAYLVYANTLGKATDAEIREKAARDAMNEANVKSIDTVAKEQSTIESLLVTLKDENASKAQKEQALNQLSAKYPEYLGQLTLENSLTDKGNQLINAQLDLIKKKAFAAASEDLYTESLKEQMKIQTELNRIKAGGEITTGESFRAIVSSNQQHTGALGFTTQADLTATAIKDLEDKLKEAQDKSDGVFKNMADGSKSLAEAFSDPSEKIKELSKTLDTFAQHSKGIFGDMASFISRSLSGISIPKAFDKVAYDEAYNAKKDELNRELQLTDQANARQQENLKAQLAKLNDEYVKNDETKKNNTTKTNSEILNADAALQAQLNSNNQAERERAFKAQTDLAQKNVLQIEALGQQESDAYFDAKVKAIKAAAAEQINQERFNAAEIKRINAQLNLDLIQNELDRQKAILQARIDENDSELFLVTKGSQEELNLRISNINLAAQKELDVIGLTEGKKKEIRLKAEKDVSDAIDTFYAQHSKDDITINISGIQAQIDAVKKGTAQEFALQQQLITAKARLAVQDEESSTDAEKVKIAKIEEINKKAYADRLALEEAFISNMLDLRNKAIEDAKNNKNADLDLIINDVTSSFGQKAEAERQKLQNNYDALQKEINNVQNQLTVAVLNPNGEDSKLVDDLLKKLQTLEVAANAAHLAINNDDSRDKGLEKASHDVDLLATSFKDLADGARDLDAGLYRVLGTLSQIASSAKVALDSLDNLKVANASKDIFGQATAAAGIFGSFFSVVGVINGLINSAAAKKQQLQEDDANALVAAEQGEVAVNDEYRKRLLLQAQINKLKIEGINAEKAALQANSQGVQSDFDKIFAELQQQGKIALPDGLNATELSALKNAANFNSDIRDYLNSITSLQGKSFDEINQLALSGKLDARGKELFQTLQNLKDEGASVSQQLSDLKDQEDQLFTGTTSDDILKSIVDAFSQGKRAVADFADDFTSLMRQAILQSFEYNSLQKPIQDFYNQFAAAAESDNTLSQSEIQQLQEQYNAIITNAGAQFDQLQKLTHIDLTTAGSDGNSLKGGIEGITESTASVIAGQFGGLRLTAMEQLQTANRSLGVLNKIEANTSRLAAVEGYLRKFDQQGIKIQ